MISCVSGFARVGSLLPMYTACGRGGAKSLAGSAEGVAKLQLAFVRMSNMSTSRVLCAHARLLHMSRASRRFVVNSTDTDAVLV